MILKTVNNHDDIDVLKRKLHAEYIITEKLDGLDGIVKPLEFNDTYTFPYIVYEDFGGDSLRNIFSALKISIADYLDISIQLAEILHQIHGKNIIHCDIKPHNIIAKPPEKKDDTWTVKLTDFGISADIFAGVKENIHNRIREGTIPYISPEQTGRINRSIDHRSDLYSLGISSYELLTGQLPFEADDPMEIIHGHIAKEPVPITTISREYPPVLSDIIMKLLEKNPEERYRGARGLKMDFEECRRQLSDNGSISSFPIGRYDIPEQFILPEKLYGRGETINDLMDIHRAVLAGESQTVFLAGPSGAGKTAIISELKKELSESNTIFISGKFERQNIDVPFSAVIQIFQDLVHQILASSEDEIKLWRMTIVDAVNPNGAILIDIIPAIKYIIGSQPEIPELSPIESQNRFYNTFEKLIRACAADMHPFILFFDDMQWADEASINLLETLHQKGNFRRTLILGTFRDTEVDNNPRFKAFLDYMHSLKSSFRILGVPLLTKGQVNWMLSDMFALHDGNLSELSGVVLQKTGGNPFFLREFLEKMYTDELIWYKKGWQWDLKSIQDVYVTDNVVELITAKILLLKKNTLELLKTASCIGFKFDISFLSGLTDSDVRTVEVSIREAYGEGLLIQSDEEWKFSHDRVSEAFYSLLSPEENVQNHYNIGKALYFRCKEKELYDNIFIICDHINRAHTVITDVEEKKLCAELNLKAAQKARKTSAFHGGHRYISHGVSFLPDDCWESLYEISLALHTLGSELASLIGSRNESDRHFDMVVQNARRVLDIIPVYEIRMIQFTSLLRFRDALNLGIEALSLLEVKMPKSAGKARMAWAFLQSKINMMGKTIEELPDAPVIENENDLAVARILMGLFEPCYLGVPDYMPIVLFKLFNFSVKKGNTPYAAYSYVIYGGILTGIFKDIEKGGRFAEAGLKLLDRLNSGTIKGKVFFAYAVAVSHWTRHLLNGLEYFVEAYAAAYDAGDLSYASYAIEHYLMNSYFSGESLPGLLGKYGKFRSLVHKYQHRITIESFELWHQFVRGMSEPLERKGPITDHFFKDTGMISNWQAKDNLSVLGHYYLALQIIYYYFGDYEESIKNADKCAKCLSAMVGLILVAEHYFYYTMALLARAAENNKLKYGEKKTVLKNMKLLEMWADKSPENFHHKYVLVKAEYKTAVGNAENTGYILALYNEAIKNAFSGRFNHDEALACERCALFCFSRGLDINGQFYYKLSLEKFSLWGAVPVANHVKEKYSGIINSLVSLRYSDLPEQNNEVQIKHDTQRSTGYNVGLFDMNTILKSSLTMSEEIQREKLLVKMMKLVMENAGAQKGYILLKEKSGLFIKTRGAVDSEKGLICESYSEKIIFPKEEFKDMTFSSPIPLSAINYVIRVKDHLMLTDAVNDTVFASDPLIKRAGIRSLLCSPVMRHDEMTGMIYIENNSISGAFSGDTLMVMKILTSQAAISLENSALYANLEEKVRDRTEIIEKQKDELEKQIDIAGKLQSSLLPQSIPQFPSLNIAFRYIPAMSVGGDFIDVLEWHRPEGVGVFICDVSGHGVPAAMISSMVKMLLSEWRSTIESPDKTLMQISKSLKHKIGGNFVTACICFIDFEKNIMRMANAGHIPLILSRADGTIKTYNAQGRVICDLSEPEFDVSVIRLDEGDRFVLYTDGIIEAGNIDREFFGVERLVRCIRDNPKMSPDELCDEVIQSVASFCGTPEHYDDDITLVIMEYHTI